MALPGRRCMPSGSMLELKTIENTKMENFLRSRLLIQKLVLRNKTCFLLFILLAFFSTVPLPAVDFAPLDGCKVIEITFQNGLAKNCPIRQTGVIRIEDQGFHQQTLVLKDQAELVYPLALGVEQKNWTFWFWCNTANIVPGAILAAVENGKTTIDISLDENRQPELVVRKNRIITGRVSSNFHVGGEDWIMYAVRCRQGVSGSQLEFIINGSNYGTCKIQGALLEGRESTLAIRKEKSNPKEPSVSRYDNLFIYAAPIDDAVLASHFREETRIAQDLFQQESAKAVPPQNAKEGYIYEFPAIDGGNTLKNGSFETGLKGWWHAGTSLLKSPPEIDSKVAADGKYSLRFNQTAEVIHYPIFVRAGSACQVSLQARSDPPGGKVLICVTPLESLDDRIKGTQNFVLTSEFRPYVWNGMVSSETRGLSLSIRVICPVKGTVWIDAVQLATGTAATYRSAANTIFVSTGDRPFNTFYNDEPVKLRVFRDPSGMLQENDQIRLKIFDVRDIQVSDLDVTAELKQHTEAAICIPRLPVGALRAVVTRNGQITDEQVFSRIPRPLDSQVNHASHYGGHFRADEKNLEYARLIGAHWNRGHDTASKVSIWNYKNRPADGKFVFHPEELALNRKYGLEPVARIEAPWKNLDELGADVEALVKGYGGDLKYLEVFNEPTAVIPAEHYAAILKTVYRNLKVG